MRLKSARRMVSVVLVVGTIARVHPQQGGMSSVARDYLNTALDLLEMNAPFRHDVRWRDLRQRTARYAAGAQTPIETYPAIAYACAEQPQNSCQLENTQNAPDALKRRILEAEKRAAAIGREALLSLPPSPFRNRYDAVLSEIQYKDARIAYLSFPTNVLREGDQANVSDRTRWLACISRFLAETHHDNAVGWILDLRGTAGPEAAPLLATLQPLLGSRMVYQVRGPRMRYSVWVEPGKAERRWGFRNSYVDAQAPIASALDSERMPVAILVDHWTMGAGEVLAIAFRGRGNTMFLGTRTGGEHDLGTRWKLPDGAVLWLLDGVVFDRDGHSYSEGIKPDIEVADPTSVPKLEEDPVIGAASAWIVSGRE